MALLFSAHQFVPLVSERGNPERQILHLNAEIVLWGIETN